MPRDGADNQSPNQSPNQPLKVAGGPVSLGALLIAALGCALLIGICIGWVDRPASTWSHEFLRRHAFFVWLSRIAEPVAPLALIGLFGAACAAAVGWRPGPRQRVLLACCGAALLAVVTTDQLKFLFGRTWTETFIDNNPSWIHHAVYGFWPFHGGRGWASFPSGHTAAIAAPMAVLWWRASALRWLWASLVLAVAAGLFGANYHFLSDIVAGGLVGVACAAAALALGELVPRRSASVPR
jgi:membrane-associated phospholipid phosphatase